MISISKENYIKAIYQIGQEKENITTSEIAERLEISNAATTDMAKKLSNEGLILYKKYRGLALTKKGERFALKVIRRHRLWELFLSQVLGLSWDLIHNEAEKLEHHSSDFLINKIDDFLGNPKFDPHGHPIPDKNGTLPEVPTLIPLSQCSVKGSYIVGGVNDNDSELINFFMKIGLVLNKRIRINQRLSFDGSLLIGIGEKEYLLSEKVAKNIFVVQEE